MQHRYSWFLLCIVVMSTYAQQPVINEFSSSNYQYTMDEDFDSPDWIEIHNPSSTALNLHNYGLTDNAFQPYRWVFPDTILPPNGFLSVWASGKNRTQKGQPLHTNFSISSEGEVLMLTAPGGVRVDSIPPVMLQRNVSYGRYPNGSNQWRYFYQPTPEAPNADDGRSSLFAAPELSHPAGLYVADFQLALDHPDTGVAIVFTLDGSEPDINNLSGTSFMYKNDYPFNIGSPVGDTLYSTYTSHIYDSTIHIYDRSADSNYFTRFNPRQHPAHYPPNPVPKGTVIRAKAYQGNLESQEVSATYFVWPQGNPFDVPIISLKIQHNHLFDYYTGIYTAGITFDTWRANNPTNNRPERPMYGNYWRRGPAWEYPLHVEIFDPNGFDQVVNQNAGFRIHGNFSRNRVIKNLRLYARNDYDEKNVFEHDLFDEPVTDSRRPDNTQYKRMLLRGDGAGGPVYNDVVFNRLMQPVFKGITRIKHAVHFINGEYWGIQAIRDRFDQFHWSTHYNIDTDNIVEVECRRTSCHLETGSPGDMSSYISLRSEIINNNMANTNHFNSVADKLCMRSFIDHMVLQVYSGDTHYERSFWRARDPQNPEYGDGKWRMYTQDFEQSLRSDRNWLSHWASQNSANDALFGNLLDNQSFKHDFINRFADLLNTAFLPARFTAITDSVMAEVQPYLSLDSNRAPRGGFFLESERQDLLNWGNIHHTRQRDEIKSHFNILGTFDVTVDVSDAAHGYVRVNTIDVLPSTVGVSNSPYPWTGVYFNNIPIQLVAQAKPGFAFSHWSGDVTGSDDTLNLNRSSNLNVQANFVAKDNPRQVIYFWLLDQRIANNQPLDSVLSTFERTGADGVMRFHSCFSGYPYNVNHPNWRKGSMERRNQRTPINYRPTANYGFAYDIIDMRGLQLRQPLHNEGQQSTVEFDIPTAGISNVYMSFAASIDLPKGAFVYVEYWSNGQWTATGLPQDSFYIDFGYRLCELDFSQISDASNNPYFKVRLRFDGDDMSADRGERIHLNNIAVEGSTFLNTSDSNLNPAVQLYPNPTVGRFMVESMDPIESVELYSLHGQLIKSPQGYGKRWEVETGDVPPAVYLVKVRWVNGKEKTLRLVKSL